MLLLTAKNEQALIVQEEAELYQEKYIYSMEKEVTYSFVSLSCLPDDSLNLNLNQTG